MADALPRQALIRPCRCGTPRAGTRCSATEGILMLWRAWRGPPMASASPRQVSIRPYGCGCGLKAKGREGYPLFLLSRLLLCCLIPPAFPIAGGRQNLILLANGISGRRSARNAVFYSVLRLLATNLARKMTIIVPVLPFANRLKFCANHLLERGPTAGRRQADLPAPWGRVVWLH